ncbi:unnamed protein product [Closterium sp. NIES-54]
MAWQGPPRQQAEWHHSFLHLQPHRTHLPVRPILRPHPPSPLLLSTCLSLLSIERVPLSAFFSSFPLLLPSPFLLLLSFSSFPLLLLPSPLLLLLSFSSSPLLLFSFDPLLLFPSPLLLYPSPPVLMFSSSSPLTVSSSPRFLLPRAFCGAQPLTPPCSGHGVCSFEPDSSRDMTACYDDVYDPPPP